MKLFLSLFCFAALFFFVTSSHSVPVKIKVLQLNVWMEGSRFEDGRRRIIDAIIQSKADLVSLNEVGHITKDGYCESLAADLVNEGQLYSTFACKNAGILSKLPILEHEVFVVGLRSFSKAIIKTINGPVLFFSAHLDARRYAPYLPRTYDPMNWKNRLTVPVIDEQTIITETLQSDRLPAIKEIIKRANQTDMPVIIAGDFNEPSHRDWTQETKNLSDHNGAVVHWPVTSILEENGFIDAYRSTYPNPLTHPGYTFPANNADKDPSQITPAPEADERDRIDYIFHRGEKLALLKIAIFGPRGWLVRNERQEQTSDDNLIEPKHPWPTDHMGLIATYQLSR